MIKKFVLIFCIMCFYLPVNAEVVRVSLDDAVRLTLRNNLDLQAKRKELGIAEADIKIANRLKNPQLQTNILIGNLSTGNASQAGAVVPIETFKRGVRKKVAIAQRKVIESQIRQFEHELKIQVMKAYFDVLYYKSVVSIMNQRKLLFEDMKEIAKNKSEKLSSYKIDMLQSDIRYKKQLIELNRAKADLIIAQFALNKVINVKDTTNMYDTQEASLFSEDLSVLEIKIPSYEMIEEIAMKYSHSIRIASNNIEKLEQECILAKRQRIPNLNVGGGVAWVNRYNGDGFHSTSGYVASGMDLPIFYTYRPEINRAKIVLDKAQMDKLSFENKLKITLKQNFNNFKYSKENMEYYKEILNESDEILKMSENRYKTGKTTLMNLIIIENGHQQILNEYLTAMNTYYDVYLDMMYNMGHDVLLEEEIFEEDI